MWRVLQLYGSWLAAGLGPNRRACGVEWSNGKWKVGTSLVPCLQLCRRFRGGVDWAPSSHDNKA